MLVPRTKRTTAQRLLACGLLATAASVCAPAPANAHFILKAPEASLAQDNLGSPQKAAPCGDDGSGVASGKVTAYQSGQTITVTINETIYHPGHYRISLGVGGPGDIPVEPVVTPDASSPCGSAPIDPNPVFPVLADGVFKHNAPFDAPQSITITLPKDVTCDHCTLQVLEFMSNHGLNDPGGCYYHHCSDISIQADPGLTTSSGGTGPGDTSSATSGTGTDSTSSGAGGAGAGGAGAGGGSPDESSGCRFAGVTPTSPGLMGLGSLVALAALTLRRRRR